MIDLRSAYAGRRVLVTGHTGFKGAWLSLWLHELGAEVYGFSLPPTEGNELRVGGILSGECLADIRNVGEFQHFVREAQPHYLFHLAAQAVVSEGYHGPLETWETNVMGTANVLESIRHTPSIKSAVIVTTDKVYRNEGCGRAFRESDELGGECPYSGSKAACEIAVQTWRKSYTMPPISTARAGNVIGGGDMTKDRLIPDCVRSFRQGQMPAIRCPEAVRPWQHVLDPLYGYLKLAVMQEENPSIAGAYNFGPANGGYLNVGDVVSRLAACWGMMGQPEPQERTFKEVPTLALESGKASAALGWTPLLCTQEAIEWTAGGYMGDNPVEQIREYTERRK
jgi:CDP-glucose 4,6-dehydratase